MYLKKILVTGSNGFIGSSIVNYLLDFKYSNVYGLAKGLNRNSNLPAEKYFSKDLTDFSGLEYQLGILKPDIIIHCAAISQVDICESNLALCINVNTKSTEVIANYCSSSQKRLIFFSTDFVFDGESKWMTEEDQPNPKSSYARSKWVAENYISKHCNDFAIIRPVLVYGYSASAGRSNIFLWIVNSVVAKAEIKVVDDQFRTPTFVGDVVKLVINVLPSEYSGVFHIGGSEETSVFNFSKRIEANTGCQVSYISPSQSSKMTGAELRPQKSCFSNSKITDLFGWKPLGLKDGILAAFNQKENVG